MGRDRICLVNRTAPLLESPVLVLHMVACIFTRCPLQYCEVDSETHLRYGGGCRFCHLSLVDGKVKSECTELDSSIEYAVCAMIFHDIGDIFPFLLDQIAAERLEKQRIFDIAWASFVLKLALSELMFHSRSLLQLLLDNGCAFEGRHICIFAEWPALRGDFCELNDFVRDNLSLDDLSHAATCYLNGSPGGIADHFTDWEDPMYPGPEILITMVMALTDRGVDYKKYVNKSGENSINALMLHQNRLTQWADNSSYVKVTLAAGGDPYFRGKSGNAFEVATKWLEDLCDAPKERLEEHQGILEDAKETMRTLQKYAIVD